MNDLCLAPFVSVVIPVKNEEMYISACLSAVMKQDYVGDFEVLVVDNGSSDRTVPIVEDYFSSFDRGRVIFKPEGTIASVRNAGWHHARGEVLAFLDGDSVPEPSWLREGVALLGAAPDISCVGFSAAPPLASDTWVEKAWFPISSTGKHRGTVEVRWLSSFNMLVRRDFFEAVQGFDENLVTCEDADLGTRLSEFSRLLLSDCCHVRHLGTVKTVSSFVRKEFWRGKNSLTSFLKNGCKLAELPSVLIPVVYLVLSVFLIMQVIIYWGFHAANSRVFLPVLLFLIVLPLLMVLRKGVRGGALVCQIWLLFTAYLVSRGVAIVFTHR
ncbi:glycosyltransferase [Geomonas limicola]|uniref:glycosyltransferase n=1 Tax=Geomonas limicola TaxID=2740186 RepID=UPI00161FA97E|nr:glycosyltransferase [Geomonas limicola]